MGRKSNATSGMDVAEKQATPLARRLNGLIVDGNALKDYLGVSAQAINQYRLGMARPSLENLCNIAEFYGVSTDYLLGLTDTPSIKEDIQAVCKTTGLSEEAISYLRRATNEHYEGRRIVLNALLENYDFYHLLGIIYECSEAMSPREEISKIPVDDRFQNHSSKEIFEALAVNWTAKVISSTVEILKREKENNGQH